MSDISYVGFRVDPDLIGKARVAMQLPANAPRSDVLRCALARIAELDPTEYTPTNSGRLRVKSYGTVAHRNNSRNTT